MIGDQHCVDGAAALDGAAIAALLADVPDWRVAGQSLIRRYKFANWQAGLAFVNTVSTMVEQQNHHPLLTMTYTYCELAFTTHSAGSTLSLNDFLCAARADALYQGAA
jgi:4a-hydroxytetrahydrobiopterin dehydratase